MRFRILTLVLISLWLFGCTPSTYRELQCEKKRFLSREELPLVFPQTFDKTVYRAIIRFNNNEISGLLFVKATADGNIRIVFSHEMGMKFFDFGFKGDKFTSYYCFKKLNNKIVKNMLRNDLQMLFTNKFLPHKVSIYCDTLTGTRIYRYPYKGKQNYYRLKLPDCHATNIQLVHNAKIKVETVVGYKNNFPETIKINHKGLNLSIQLNRIVL